jgi:tRNA (cytosine49-C5)-methyltransferase
METVDAIVPSDRRAAFDAALTEPRPTGVRVNALRATSEEVEPTLRALGGEPGFTDCHWLLPPGSARALQQTEAWQLGHVHIQSPSSIAATLALDPQPGEAILDLCAAPGSKASHIKASIGGGRLVANDLSRNRCFKMRAVLARLGARADVWTGPGERVGFRNPEAFDRVLADVPCSGEGRFHVDDPASFAGWTPKKVKRLASLQKALLHSAIDAVRPGGVVLYSTCTMSPAENEGVLARALKRYDGRIELEELPVDLPGALPALCEWNGKRWPDSIARARRLVAGPVFDGFFLARIRKLA